MDGCNVFRLRRRRSREPLYYCRKKPFLSEGRPAVVTRIAWAVAQPIGRRQSMSDALSCDEGKLQDIGAIQEYGYLFALEKDEEAASGIRIAAVSTNVVDLAWIHVESAADLIGEDIGHIFPAEAVEDVHSLVKRHTAITVRGTSKIIAHANRSVMHISIDTGDETVALTCHLASSSDGLLLLEVWPKQALSVRANTTPGLTEVVEVLDSLPGGATPLVVTAALCDALMEQITSYERAMVYRFAEDGCGEVIYEAIREGAEVDCSYLHLCFPAGDIPPAARALFRRNGVRIIADTSMTGVKVTTGSQRRVIDLSCSALRAPTKCHLEYLRNMGVKASMVVAITVDDTLWGLINFHSYTSTVIPSYEERGMVGLTTAFAASAIAHSNRERIAGASLCVSQTLAQLARSRTLYDFVSEQKESLIRALQIDSIALFEHSRKMVVFGNDSVGLTMDEGEKLLAGRNPSFATSFVALEGRGVAFFAARSILCAFIRGSKLHDVRWAGRPEKQVIDTARMHPRASFEEFVEKAKRETRPWSPSTIKLLDVLRLHITAHVHKSVLPDDLQDVFALVSHELRTPFHGVMGSLEVLETGEECINSDERLDIIRSALQSGESMLVTLNHIVDVVKHRYDRGSVALPFSSGGPIKSAVSAMNHLAATNSVTIITEAEPSCTPDVVGDEGRIRDIMHKLVNNAIKFTPSGGTVRISLVKLDSLVGAMAWWERETARFDANVWNGQLKATSDQGNVGWYIYCVEDTGAGVLARDLSGLVKTYRQISEGALKLYQGTGLGLRICNLHVSAMEGALGIASTVRRKVNRGGTLFVCVLPLSRSSTGRVVAKGEVQGEAAATVSTDAIGDRKIKFVVIDDSIINIKLVSRKIEMCFNECDVEVVVASDGLQGIELIRSERQYPDDSLLAGVFMDFYMPHMDGVQCTKLIRDEEAKNGWPRIPICGCTANATEGAQQRFMRAGVDKFIRQPWGPRVLEDVCNGMIAQARRPDAQLPTSKTTGC